MFLPNNEEDLHVFGQILMLGNLVVSAKKAHGRQWTKHE